MFIFCVHSLRLLPWLECDRPHLNWLWRMSELLFDDVFKVDNVDPDGKKYDKGTCISLSLSLSWKPCFSLLFIFHTHHPFLAILFFSESSCIRCFTMLSYFNELIMWFYYWYELAPCELKVASIDINHILLDAMPL